MKKSLYVISILLMFSSCMNTEQKKNTEKTPVANKDLANDKSSEINLNYKHLGKGEPVIFLHGIWMSNVFFEKQEKYFGEKYAYYAPDFRGHGNSPDNGSGHTIKTYAEDLKRLIENENLKNVNLVGWSMGSFVIWEYLKNYGSDNIKTITVVDQGPTDLQKPDWDLAPLNFDGLVHFMDMVQTNQEEAAKALIPLMFKDELPKSELDWMVKEVVKIKPNSAASILFGQSIVDYRSELENFKIPALLIFGKDDKLLKSANGNFIDEKMPNSKLVIFENSGHCAFIEQPNKFNQLVDAFIQENNR